ncbi:MAG TPA: hypothetical protein VN719_09550 [Gemmatimonadales bacterium]|nr:hypothetical protein [Gemmatimonadales bacterium]
MKAELRVEWTSEPDADGRREYQLVYHVDLGDERSLTQEMPLGRRTEQEAMDLAQDAIARVSYVAGVVWGETDNRLRREYKGSTLPGPGRDG